MTLRDKIADARPALGVVHGFPGVAERTPRQYLGNTLNWLSSQAALGLQTDAAVTLYRLCRACNPYSARPSPR